MIYRDLLSSLTVPSGVPVPVPGCAVSGDLGAHQLSTEGEHHIMAAFLAVCGHLESVPEFISATQQCHQGQLWASKPPVGLEHKGVQRRAVGLQRHPQSPAVVLQSMI